MGHAVGPLFVTPTLISGNVRALSPTASTAASNTKVTVAALTSNTTYRFSPEATVSAAGAPAAAPATLANTGWRLTPLIALNDPGTLTAGSVTATVVLSFSQAITTATTSNVTGILYAAGTELARATSAAFTPASGANTLTLTLTWASARALPAGAAIDLEMYLTIGTNTAISATTVTMTYTSTGTRVSAGLDYTIQAGRTASESLTTADSPARRVTTARTLAEATTTADAATRAVTRPRAVTETTTVSDTTTRTVARARTIIETVPTTEAPTRSYVGARRVVETTSTTDTIERGLIYGRTVREYPVGVDPDYPVTAPTRTLAGTALDHETGKPLAGATVRLFRDRDDRLCQVSTTDAAGGYSFARDKFDPETYYVTVQATGAAGAPQVHGHSDRGLVPA